MHIIELTELQFKNYSNIHSKKNYKQSVEYAKLKQENGYTPLYVGLIDESNNVHAASLILEKKINNKHKYGYVPNGYLINFYNLDLVKTFTIELKNYLKKLNYIYIRINPLINYQVYNSDFILKENNSGIINELKKLDYNLIPNTSKYKMILKTNDIHSTYKNFKRSLRRNINNCLKKGILVYQGTEQDKKDFLNLIENKTRYQKMMELFNTPNNYFEFYLAKINPETYINNYRYLLKKEQINNEVLNQKLKNPNIKKTNNLFMKKMTSDKLITNYNTEIINGTNLFKTHPEGVIISAVAVITNQKEVTFIKECYTDEFKHIRSVPMIKWEIIKKHISNGYKKFDLGDVSITKNQITKTGYNGEIIEYSNSFDLVINEMLYKLNGFAKKNSK
ncbi:MAG: aminoacyltransferase [Erysipelotrichaceae bacterium]|nr:aminoacyltransferase [Erysipelotrichaceae bacterium]